MLPERGTTSFLATIVIPSKGNILDMVLKRLGSAIGTVGHGAVLEGIYAEVS